MSGMDKKPSFLPHTFFSLALQESILELAQPAAERKAWNEVESLYLKALNCLHKTPGSDQLEVAMVLHNLGLVLSAQGRELEARQMQREVTEIITKTFRKEPA